MIYRIEYFGDYAFNLNKYFINLNLRLSLNNCNAPISIDRILYYVSKLISVRIK